MAVFNMPRPNTRPHSGGMGRPQLSTAAADVAKPGYGGYTKPVQNEMGARPGFGGTMPQRPPQQSVKPIGPSFGGQANFAKPVETIAPPPQQIQPIGGGFAGNADFGQRQFAPSLASAFQQMPPQAPQHMPWWYRRGGQTPTAQPRAIGSLGAALDNAARSGGSLGVMNPTLYML